jgi:O-antigen/teichoic acid export membrane protein
MTEMTTPGRGRGLGKSLIRDAALYGTGHVVARSTYLILIPVLTRALRPEELGAVELLMAGSILATSAVSLEINQGLARFVPAGSTLERRALASTALWFAAGAFAALTAAALLGAELIAALVLGSAEYSTAVRVAAMYTLVNGLFLVVHGQLRWELRAGSYAAVAVIAALASTVGVVVLVGILQGGVASLFVGYATGSLIALTIGAYLARESLRGPFSVERLRQLLSYSAPLAPAAGAAFLAAYADRFVIGAFLGNTQVGVYSVGYRLASIMSLATMAIQLALPPLIYARYEIGSTPKDLAGVFKTAVGMAALLWLALSLFASELVAILATSEYEHAASVVPYISAALLLNGLIAFAPGLNIAGRTKLVAGVSIISASLGVGLNVALVPSLGVLGSAIASVLAAATAFTFMMAMSQRHYPVPIQWTSISVLASVAVGAYILSQLITASSFAGTAVKVIILVAVAAVFVLIAMRQSASAAARRHDPNWRQL